jgi:hypothetical protein
MDEIELLRLAIESRLDGLEEKVKVDTGEFKRQLKAVWANLDNLKKVSNESLILAKHADKGYVEIYTELKNLKINFERIENSNEKIEEMVNGVPGLISKLEVNLANKLTNNVRWVIGIIISFLAILGIIVK